MKDWVKCALTLSGDAFKALEQQASPRKRGEFVSKLLLEYSIANSGVDQADIEGMRLGLLGLASANKTLEGRVLKLERQIAVLVAGQK